MSVPSPYASLLHNAVMLILQQHRFGLTRTLHLDHALPHETASTINADPRYLKLQKRILDCEEYRTITRLDHRIKQTLNRLALPTRFLPGLYLVPATLVPDVDAALTRYQEHRQQAVEQFLAGYPQAQAQALVALNIFFDQANYPSLDELRAAFSVTVHYLSFDMPAALHAIDRTIFEREQSKIQSRINQMLEEVRTYLRTTLRELIHHLAERLQPGPDGERKVLRRSTFEQLMTFLDTFEARNLVANDQELADLVTRCRSVITGVEPQDLKTQPLLADAIQRDLQVIAGCLDTMIVPAPRRRLRFATTPDLVPA